MPGGIVADGVYRVYGGEWFVKCEVQAGAIFAPLSTLTCGKGAKIVAPDGLLIGPADLAHDLTLCNIRPDTPIFYSGDRDFCTQYDDVIAGAGSDIIDRLFIADCFELAI